MKVLFAVNNDNISEAVLKKYQQDYKEIISYKNVYYFNAILKELQKDKSYDRVVISEDLEPFANNNYDTIDKFLFEKLDKISDEATNEEGNETQVIFICSDRRVTSDMMLTKLFSIGIYNAVIGQDRSIDKLCFLIRKPRGKKEAKQYYKIISDDANYESENEASVSEVELQNILAYYKKIGRNEEKYVDSFNNIVAQYTDTQLKIIIKYLPINVKAVLEEKSSKYQELVLGNRRRENRDQYTPRKDKEQIKKEEPVSIKMLKEQTNKEAIQRPIVVPSSITKKQVRKLVKKEILPELDNKTGIKEEIEKVDDIDEFISEEIQKDEQKRGRGRPRKKENNETQISEKPKRGRGRPKKTSEEIATIEQEKTKKENEDLKHFKDNQEDIDLFNLDDDQKEEDNQEDIDLFNLDDDQKEEDNQEDLDFFNLDDDEKKEGNQENVDLFDLNSEEEAEEEKNVLFKSSNAINDFSKTLARDKKIVSFVGTTKNGTSFIINNLAELLSSMGIPTAILDMTKSKNAYYIYTNNEENLRQTASKSIDKLKSGIAEGVKVNKNLSIFTDLPGEEKEYNDVQNILETLSRNFSVVLIDCDFNTGVDIFDKSQEIYLVQSMDVLTIQPLTAFLRNLKSKGILKQEKIKIVINKEQKVKGLSPKVLIGGIAFYNDPAMSYMTELFDREKVQFCVIPFEIQNYIKYLESLVNCSIKLGGYTKSFMIALRELANMVYPLINRQEYSPRGNKYKDAFSNEMNDTLNKMKNTYK